MHQIYDHELKTLEALTDLGEKLNFGSSILRSILQTSTIVALEVIRKLSPSESYDLSLLIERLKKPSDGLPLQILDKSIPIIRSTIDKNFMIGWFENTENQGPLGRDLLDWIEFRNKSAHGVIDKRTTEEWSNKITNLIIRYLSSFKYWMPNLSENSQKIRILKKDIPIETPLIYEGKSFVISEIKEKKSIFKIKAQTLSLEDSKTVNIDLNEDNIFSDLEPDNSKYKLISINTDSSEYILEHNIPIRQTETFEGRGNELLLLKDWLNDEDSRRCLIYGDGGYGKTTLVLEFLNNLLDGNIDVERQLPTVICYYTAKKTKWSHKGIEYFSTFSPVVDDCIRELIQCIHPVLSKDWYTQNGLNLIKKAETLLKEKNFNRNDILIILDNTETLATTTQQTKELSQTIETIGRLIGRVLITSRRQESIEAKQILVEGLSTEECVNLLKSLANENDAESIRKAGEPKLRKVSEKLMKKPILLEALAKYVGRTRVGIESALDALYQKSNNELLDFLYEDAWERISDIQKELFYVISTLNCPLDQYSISHSCQLLEVQHSEFQNSLSETHFAILTDYGHKYEIELVDLARKFFLKKCGESPKSTQNSVQEKAALVEAHVKKMDEIDRNFKRDRVTEAFRNEYAREAKIYSDKGDFKNAIAMYEVAIEEDPLNSALHDRFAWLLANRTSQYDTAQKMAKRAYDLNNKNCDATVNLALIEYRLGNIKEGDFYIDKSVALGRPESFSLLRKAIARSHQSRNSSRLEKKVALINEAKIMLRKAARINPLSTGYDKKNSRDIDRYLKVVNEQSKILEQELIQSKTLS